MPMTESRRRRLHTSVKLKGHKLTHEQLLEIDNRSRQDYYGRPTGKGYPCRNWEPPRQPPTSVELGLTFRDLASRLAPNCAQRVTWRDLWMYQRFRVVRGSDLHTQADKYRFPCEWFSHLNGKYAHPKSGASEFDYCPGCFGFCWHATPLVPLPEALTGWASYSLTIEKREKIQADHQKECEEKARTAPFRNYETAAAEWWREKHGPEAQRKKKTGGRYYRPMRPGPPERSSPSVWEPQFMFNAKAWFMDHPCRRDKGRWHLQLNNGEHYKEVRKTLHNPRPEDLKCKWLERDTPNFLPYLKRYCLRLERKRSVAEWEAWIDQKEKDQAGTDYHKRAFGQDKVRFAWKAMLEHYLWDSTQDLDSEFWEWAAARKQWLKPDNCEDVEYSEC